jgi:hypothetical protein
VPDYIPVNDTVSAELRYTWDGQHVENVIHFTKSGGWSEEDRQTLGAALVDWYAAELNHRVSEDVTLNELFITNLETEDGETTTITDGLPITGAVAVRSCSNNDSLCASLRSANRGRSARGRFYAVGLRQDQLVNNTWDAEYAEQYRANIEALTTDDYVPDGMDLVIVSRQHNNAPRVAGVTYQVLAVVIVDLIVDSQRRRLPGRGR